MVARDDDAPAGNVVVGAAAAAAMTTTHSSTSSDHAIKCCYHHHHQHYSSSGGNTQGGGFHHHHHHHHQDSMTSRNNNNGRVVNGYGGGGGGCWPTDVRSSFNDRYPPPLPSSSSSRFLGHDVQDRPPHRSHSERHGRWPRNSEDCSPPKTLYRSNSSLDLEQEFLLEEKSAAVHGTQLLRREYGSASSIDVMSTSGESFFAMLSNYGTGENADQRSPGPAKIVEYLRGKTEPVPAAQNASNIMMANGGSDAVDEATSPKARLKLHRLWESSKEKGGKGKGTESSSSFIFRKLRGGKGGDGNSAETSSKGSDNSLDADGRNEDKLRRKAFAHYDVQSISANLLYASRLRNILGRRRNTTTGASAASMVNRNNVQQQVCSSNVEDPEDADQGDSRSNDLVLSCPFFRNELGGEEERVVSLTRTASDDRKRRPDGWSSNRSASGSGGGGMHRPNLACGLSILEGAIETHWNAHTCPYQRRALQRENVDHGAHYYEHFFQGREHQNWFGIDDTLGPVAVSVRREKADCSGNNREATTSSSSVLHQYRLIIRTSELATLRGTVLEESIPSLRQTSGRGIRAKEVLDYIAPELQLSCLRLGLASTQTEEQLLKLDQQGLINHYKIGILYCRAGQSTEEEMYNNEHSGPAFDEFLDTIGQRVRLKGFDKYRAQLDNKTDSTGTYSVYASYQDCEVMFHVSTMLPYSPNNRQQLLRKRHIGNDIATIVFQEPEALPFTPRNIRSHFQHVFVVVRAVNPCSDNTRYRVAVSRSKEVPTFGPLIPREGVFPKSKAFAEFILAKVINAENAAHRSDKFVTMATRTRQEYLKDLAGNHVSTATIDTGPRFPMLSFGGKKKEKPRPRFIPDACIRGAVVWQVQVDDYGQSSVLDCFLGISGDTVVLVDEVGRDVVFACACYSILGWSSHTSSLRIYYHQGECIIVRTKDPEVDEIQEIVSRFSCVTQGCETQEFTLRRNSLGQLGFHVQQDGLITEVEQYGFAWQSGLRQNSRLVEICKVVVSTLTYDQMVDLLKNSLMVTVTVIPPVDDGTPRRGCNLHNCGYLSLLHCGGDYENLNEQDSDEGLPQVKVSPKHKLVVQPASRNAKLPVGLSNSESSSSSRSPGQSTPSSGYSSRKSVAVSLEHRYKANNNGESTSASSQSSDEKWYDLNEVLPEAADNRGHVNKELSSSSPPPPLPARHVAASSSRRRDPLSTSYNLGGQHSSDNYVHLPGSHHHHHQQQQQQQHSLAVAGRVAHFHDVALHRQMAQSLNLGSESGRVARTNNAPLSDQVLHDRLHQLRSSVSARTKPQANVAVVLSSPPPQSSSSCEKLMADNVAERCVSSRSEDEQSCGSSASNSLSPRSHRRHPVNSSGTSSGNSSKNQSPCTVGRGQVDAATECREKRQAMSSLRNSGLGSSSESTFQEDLLKLINPDLIELEDVSQLAVTPTASSKDSRTTTSTECSVSRETPNRSSARLAPARTSPSDNPNAGRNNGGAVIFTTARPATVISTSSSSPAPSEQKLSKEERSLSPRAITTHSGGALTSKSLSSLPNAIMPLPEGVGVVDWPALVDNATKAMEGDLVPTGITTAGISNLIPWIDDVTSRLGLDPLPTANARRIRELEFRVRLLEEELAKERHRKAALEMEVRRLRDENNRLQEESQTAAAQLRRFTEWFFQAIDK